jgi:hypothetical protein
VIASVHDPNMSSQPNPTLALIQVDDCQIIPAESVRLRLLLAAIKPPLLVKRVYKTGKKAPLVRK